MYEGIFQATTIPVLEQVVRFAQARHTVLAGNLANLDTPGYRVRDLPVEDFRAQLREAIAARQRPQASVSPGDMRTLAPGPPLAKVAENCQTILRHDDANVGIENQAAEMVKNQLEHNVALAIMASQFRLLEAAISERA